MGRLTATLLSDVSVGVSCSLLGVTLLFQLEALPLFLNFAAADKEHIEETTSENILKHKLARILLDGADAGVMKEGATKKPQTQSYIQCLLYNTCVSPPGGIAFVLYGQNERLSDSTLPTVGINVPVYWDDAGNACQGNAVKCPWKIYTWLHNVCGGDFLHHTPHCLHPEEFVLEAQVQSRATEEIQQSLWTPVGPHPNSLGNNCPEGKIPYSVDNTGAAHCVEPQLHYPSCGPREFLVWQYWPRGNGRLQGGFRCFGFPEFQKCSGAVKLALPLPPTAELNSSTHDWETGELKENHIVSRCEANR